SSSRYLIYFSRAEVKFFYLLSDSIGTAYGSGIVILIQSLDAMPASDDFLQWLAGHCQHDARRVVPSHLRSRERPSWRRRNCFFVEANGQPRISKSASEFFRDWVFRRAMNIDLPDGDQRAPA
ncbi:hypothetical protein AB1L30_00520, partial [Bremerella sp. JC817]|uniref:hypothetical protein n=1 Tax=Bremerella sp. JC817 TaxID=3231756 RepID=UPI0034593F02